MNRFHPIVPFVYLIGLLFLTFTWNHPVFLLTEWAGAIVLAVNCAGGKKTWRSLRFILPFAVLLALLNPLLVRRGGTVLFYFLDNPVTLEAAAYGVSNMFSLLTVLTLFISFNRIIDQSAFLYLTARWFPQLAFVLDMSLRSAYRFPGRISELTGTQKTRGVRADTGRLKTRATNAVLLLNAFTARTLEEGMETAAVLRARDYNTGPGTHYRAYRFGTRDAVWLTVTILIFIAFMTGYGLGLARYDYYPLLRFPALGWAEWAFYGVMLIYLLWPLFYTVRRRY
jgi:energy-coupling factor transport system permease protein